MSLAGRQAHGLRARAAGHGRGASEKRATENPVFPGGVRVGCGRKSGCSEKRRPKVEGHVGWVKRLEPHIRKATRLLG